MKSSTSTSSLTALDEKGCILCTEEEGEAGEVLFESKLLTQCRCVFRAHRTCWEERILKTEEKLCPSCNKTVIPAFMIYPTISQERGHGGDDMSYYNWHMIFLCFLLMVIVILIIVGFQFHWFTKEN